jgi:hypothetical protein
MPKKKPESAFFVGGGRHHHLGQQCSRVWGALHNSIIRPLGLTFFILMMTQRPAVVFLSLISLFRCCFLFVSGATVTTYVATTNQFNNAVGDNTIIEVTSDISLSTRISINTISSLLVKGNGYTLDGRNSVRCFRILDSNDIHIQNITIKNGYSSVSFSAVCFNDR